MPLIHYLNHFKTDKNYIFGKINSSKQGKLTTRVICT